MSRARELSTVASRSADIKAGTTAFFAMSSAPTGWLKANGALVSRTEYADLFAAIGTTYGAGDGSSTFALPDLRGEFMRGWDDGRGVDSGRAFGSAQGELSKQLRIRQTNQNLTAEDQTFTVPLDGGEIRPHRHVAEAPGNTHKNFYFSVNSNETRPRNAALLACIKF